MNEAIVWAIVFAIVIAVLEEVLRRFYAATIVRWWKIVTAMIEIVIYRRSEPAQKELLRSVLGKASSDDEILFVGRTHYGLLNQNSDVAAIVETLKRGVILKFLFLDGKALRESPPGRQIDLRSLRLPDAYGRLAHDLGITEAKLSAIREQCEKSKFPGWLLIYRTDLVIQSSIVIHARRATENADEHSENRVPVHFLYDFSFGDEESDKFTQYYKPHRKQHPSDFCSRLYKFYSAMFDPEASSFDFALSYRPSEHNLHSELGQLAVERWSSFVEDHSESEAIRNNPLLKILPAAAGVFSALRHNRSAPPPVSVQVELTNICSTNCTHCFRWNKPQVREMDVDLAKKIFSELSDFQVRTVTLSGGEPTQHSRFIELLLYACEKKLAVGVLSNGVGITPQILEAIHSNARWLRLSMDGSNSVVYGQVRKSRPGEDAFDELMFTLRRFKDLNGKAERCKLAICYTIQKSNAHDVADMIRLVRRERLPGGDKCLIFKFAHGSNGFLCTEEQVRDLKKLSTDQEFEHAANLDYLKWFLEHQSNIRDVARGRPAENLYLRQDTRCFTPHLFALIDPKGDLYPCCFLFEDNKNYTAPLEEKRRKHRIGNVASQSFAEIWESKGNNKQYQQVRNDLAVINPSGHYSACGECTRHCNHNRWLSKLYAEYNALYAAGGDSDAAMNAVLGRLMGDAQVREVWL